MRRWAAFALVASLLSTPVAYAQPKKFPPEMIDSVWWSDLIDDEPTLWRPGDLRGFTSRLRLTIAGIAKLKVLIRIDEHRSGRATGRVVLAQRTREGLDLIADVDRSFRVSAAQLAALRTRIAAAQLWKVAPQEHWASKDEVDICLDGEQLVFERVDTLGYRFSEANAQCTAPPALLEVARAFIELSGERQALDLLR